MKHLASTSALAIVLIAMSASTAISQTYNAMSGGYNTGYGTVYGSFGYAMATQNIYNTTQLALQKAMARAAMIKQFGAAAVEKAEREAAAGTRPSNKQIVVAPPRVVRNYGSFRPDPAVDTATLLADNLGETAEEKALIKTIFQLTKTEYEKEAAKLGFKNNIAGGLTFFTAAAMTVYNDGPEPSDAAAKEYYDIVNAGIDDIPEFAKVPNRDKQNFNNILIGFSGMVLATYAEGKQNGDAATVTTARKLAGALIEMVLKTDPKNLRLENGRIVLK